MEGACPVGSYLHNYIGIVTQTSADTFFCLCPINSKTETEKE